jgi:hypothetical protein
MTEGLTIVLIWMLSWVLWRIARILVWVWLATWVF